MKLLKKIGKCIFNFLVIIMIVIIMLSFYSFIKIQVQDNCYANFFGYTFLSVQTGSMSGTIEVKDIVIVKITKEVKKDDIISFQESNEIITHRIIEKNENEIITKGDANNTEDEPITDDKVIGKVVYIIPKVAIWIEVFKTPKVYIPCICTILFGIFAYVIEDEKKNTEEIKEKTIDKKDGGNDEKKV